MKHSLSGSDWIVTGWYRNQWRFTRSMELDKMLVPAVPSIPGTVPGAVQADLLAAGLLDDPFVGMNSVRSEWVNNREWFCDKRFRVPEELAACERLRLVFDGLDGRGEIYLNGERLAGFSSMFLPVELEVTGKLAAGTEHLLRVVFFQSPEVDGQYGWTSRIRTITSRFGYVWDWCPRIVSVGIWEDVRLEGHSGCRILDFYPRSERDPDSAADRRLVCRVSTEAFVPGRYRFRYTVSRGGRECASAEFDEQLPAARSGVTHELSVPAPELWFPNGSGAQPLYDAALTVTDAAGAVTDRAVRRIGFRSVEMKMNERSPRDALPYTLTVNGERLFVKGVNWVPVSPLYGTVTRRQYEAYLGRFREMGCNLVRVWGGAILEKEAFYDVCDELGLVVWQEFPQSSSGMENRPSDDPAFLEELEAVARTYLRRRRHHASLAVWCGGNELMWDDGTPVDTRHTNIAMLSRLVSAEHPGAVFLPASASGPRFTASEAGFGRGVHHDVHGPWLYGGEEDHYRFFNRDDALFRSETGCPAPSRTELLERFSDGMALWPPSASNLFWTHRGSWWILLPEMTRMFGPWNGAEELGRYVILARYLQAEALRYAAESALRRRPEASGLIVWMGNEPFPNAANTSVLEYDGAPKPAYGALAQAFSPLHLSASFDRLVWDPGERFRAGLFVTASHPDGREVAIRAEVFGMDGRVIAETLSTVTLSSFTVPAGELELPLDGVSGAFCLRLGAGPDGSGSDDAEFLENTYVFCIAPRAEDRSRHAPLAALRALPAAGVRIVREGGSLYAENRSGVPALGVSLRAKDQGLFAEVSPSFLSLRPDERRRLTVTVGSGSAVRRNALDPEEIVVEGLNV